MGKTIEVTVIYCTVKEHVMLKYSFLNTSELSHEDFVKRELGLKRILVENTYSQGKSVYLCLRQFVNTNDLREHKINKLLK